MLLIVGLGAAVNQYWPWAVQAALVPSELLSSDGQPLTRIQTLTNDQTGQILLVVLAITALAFAVFVYRHWYRIHRLVNRGEKFVYQHVWIDVAAVFVFTAGFVLTR